MKPKHTPGPWTAEPFLLNSKYDDPVGVYKVEPAFRQLTDLYETLGPDPEDENYDPDFYEKVHEVNAANARLIACAPELLSALQQVFEDWTTLVGEDLKENNEAVQRIWQQCEAAINKATT